MGRYEAESKGLILGNSLFNTIRWIAQILLPAAGALYFALSEIWGFPHAQEILGTLAAVDIFLGAILGLARKNYNNSDAKYDGALVVEHINEFKDNYSLEIDTPLEEVPSKNEITLKVKNP